jgi:hypothetical protein
MKTWHTWMSLWGELDSALLMLDCFGNIIHFSGVNEASPKRGSELTEPRWKIGMPIRDQTDSLLPMFDDLGDVIQVSCTLVATLQCVSEIVEPGPSGGVSGIARC